MARSNRGSKPAAKAGDGPSTPATTALDRAGLPYHRHGYVHDEQAASYGLEAVDALGVQASRVFKTLVADTGTELVVGVVPVEGRLDLKALAAAVGAKSVTMADPAAAQRSSGFVVGGISPIGQRRALRTVVDVTAATHDTIFVSVGRRGFDIEIAPHDLITSTNGSYGAIGRD